MVRARILMFLYGCAIYSIIATATPAQRLTLGPLANLAGYAICEIILRLWRTDLQLRGIPVRLTRARCLSAAIVLAGAATSYYANQQPSEDLTFGLFLPFMVGIEVFARALRWAITPTAADEWRRVRNR